jgi:hypothetical protein
MRRSENIALFGCCDCHADWLIGILSPAWEISATDITLCKSAVSYHVERSISGFKGHLENLSNSVFHYPSIA